MDPLYFASKPVGAKGFTLDGIKWTGTDAVTAKGTTTGVSAAPLGTGASATGTTFMAVEGGGTDATFSTPQTSLTLYWGSIDGDVTGTASAVI